MIRISKRPGDYILIGRQGENLARQVVFDIACWEELYGVEGRVELIYQRPRDSAPYPVVIERDGNTVAWTITDTDTATAGNGRAELRYYVGEALVKSATSIITVSAALGVPEEVPDQPGKDWLEQALDAARRAEEAAERAESGGGGSGGDTGTPGADGEDGGYYTPKVSQPTETTMLVEHTPSKVEMPAVDPVIINLPTGPENGSDLANVQIILRNVMTIIKAQVEDDAGTPQAYSCDVSGLVMECDTLIAGLASSSGDDTGGDSGGDSGSGEADHTHSYTSAVTTEATCETAGVRTYACSCGDSYTESIPATGHNYVDGTCSVCGASNPDAETEATLTSISATYSGGDVAVGTAVTDLTGIVVTAHYSDGSSENVTGYTLSGEIAEGENTVTVTYQGKTATFTVTGVAESTEVEKTTLEVEDLLADVEFVSVTTGQFNNGMTYGSVSSEKVTLSAGTYYLYDLQGAASGVSPRLYIEATDGALTAADTVTITDNNGNFKNGTYNEYDVEEFSYYQPVEDGYMVEFVMVLAEDITGYFWLGSKSWVDDAPGYTWLFTKQYNPHKNTLVLV